MFTLDSCRKESAFIKPYQDLCLHFYSSVITHNIIKASAMRDKTTSFHLIIGRQRRLSILTWYFKYLYSTLQIPAHQNSTQVPRRQNILAHLAFSVRTSCPLPYYGNRLSCSSQRNFSVMEGFRQAANMEPTGCLLLSTPSVYNSFVSTTGPESGMTFQLQCSGYKNTKTLRSQPNMSNVFIHSLTCLI